MYTLRLLLYFLSLLLVEQWGICMSSYILVFVGGADGSLDPQCWCRFIDGWRTPGIKLLLKEKSNYKTLWPFIDATRILPLTAWLMVVFWTVLVHVLKDWLLVLQLLRLKRNWHCIHKCNSTSVCRWVYSKVVFVDKWYAIEFIVYRVTSIVLSIKSLRGNPDKLSD